METPCLSEQGKFTFASKTQDFVAFDYNAKLRSGYWRERNKTSLSEEKHCQALTE
jgi:hypothetical protein